MAFQYQKRSSTTTGGTQTTIPGPPTSNVWIWVLVTVCVIVAVVLFRDLDDQNSNIDETTKAKIALYQEEDVAASRLIENIFRAIPKECLKNAKALSDEELASLVFKALAAQAANPPDKTSKALYDARLRPDCEPNNIDSSSKAEQPFEYNFPCEFKLSAALRTKYVKFGLQGTEMVCSYTIIQTTVKYIEACNAKYGADEYAKCLEDHVADIVKRIFERN